MRNFSSDKTTRHLLCHGRVLTSPHPLFAVLYFTVLYCTYFAVLTSKLHTLSIHKAIKSSQIMDYPMPPPPPGMLPAAFPAPLAGTKRKSTDVIDPALSALDFHSVVIPPTAKLDSCNVVRGKINRFIESGEMKIGEFCNALGVSENSYRRFLAMNGKDQGMQSDTYIAAWQFFKKRELAGIKPPKKQRIVPSASASASSSSAAAGPSDAVPDISTVRLEGMLLDESFLFFPFSISSIYSAVSRDRTPPI